VSSSPESGAAPLDAAGDGGAAPQRLPSLSLRVSVTDRCQLRCSYCMPATGVRKRSHSEILRFEDILRLLQVARRHYRVDKVHLTGGEPLLRPGIVDLVAMLAAEGVADLALTTNGQLLAPLARDLRAAGLARVNVSVDSLEPERYRRLSGGGDLALTLAGIAAAQAAGLSPIKLNTVALADETPAEAPHMLRWALAHGVVLRFLELMPIGTARSEMGRFVSSADLQALLARDFELEALPLRPGASARDWRVRERGGELQGRVGFISSETHPFCRGCRRLRLTSDGRLLSCLASPEGPSLRAALRARGPAAEAELLAALQSQLACKGLRQGYSPAQSMSEVGG